MKNYNEFLAAMQQLYTRHSRSLQPDELKQLLQRLQQPRGD